MEIQTLVNSLKKQIEQECKKVRQEKKRELDELIARAVTEGRLEGQKEAQLLWQKAKEEAERAKNKLQLETEKRKLKLKQSLLNQVKELAAEKLKAFTETDAYQAWFEEAVSKILLEVQEIDSCQLLVAPQDKQLALTVCQKKANIQVVADENLPAGSLLLKAGILTVDNSLLTRLENCLRRHYDQLVKVLFPNEDIRL